jgi:hypothetical protein
MKKELFIITICFMLMGCAAVSKWTMAQADCAADPACLEQAKKYASVGTAVASPWGPVAGGAAASCIMFVALGILGMKKGNKK